MNAPDRDAAAYTDYHPRWYRQRVSTYWWLGRWVYLQFVLREISSVFVACFVVLALWRVRALGAGPQAYAQFQKALSGPLWIVLNAAAFLFVLFHTVTWFNLAPRAMTVRLGGKRLPDAVIAGTNYAVWLGISVVMAWFLVRG